MAHTHRTDAARERCERRGGPCLLIDAKITLAPPGSPLRALQDAAFGQMSPEAMKIAAPATAKAAADAARRAEAVSPGMDEWRQAARISGIDEEYREHAAQEMEDMYLREAKPRNGGVDHGAAERARKRVLRALGGKKFYCGCRVRGKPVGGDYDPFSLEAQSGRCGPVCPEYR